MGLDYAEGDIINFLDPDDLWSNNTFEEVSTFFRLYPNIDIIAGRLKFFESNNNYHPLDYKFTNSRIINLKKEYNCIQLSAASSFIRRRAIVKKKICERAVSWRRCFVSKQVINHKIFLWRS